MNLNEMVLNTSRQSSTNKQHPTQEKQHLVFTYYSYIMYYLQNIWHHLLYFLLGDDAKQLCMKFFSVVQELCKMFDALITGLIGLTPCSGIITFDIH